MSSINIRRDVTDPFYRYKMPPIVSKIEGRGNGIKTAIVNISDVARALSRPPAYVIKFFGFELGAQTWLSEDQDRYIVNGAHDSAKLQDSLDSFINKFVLCGSCKNPETDFVIHKNGVVERDCKACGVKTDVDPRHKLTSFIIKNPPQNAKSKRKAMANAGANTSSTEAAAADGDASTSASADNNDDDELTRRINAEAANLPSMKDTNDEEVEWSADVSEEAVKARQRELERAMGGLAVEEDTTPDTVYTEFGEWVENNRAEGDVEIYKKASELDIVQKVKTVQVLAQCLFSADVASEIVEHVGLLSKLVTTPEHEKAFLGGLERYIGLQHPNLISKIPTILFKLYESNLLSEEVAQHWGTRTSKRYVDRETSKKVRRAARPFIDWLEEAESEEESEEE